MNLGLTERYVQRTHRLALGLEPLDAVLWGRLTHPVRVELEGELPFRPPSEQDQERPYRRDVGPGDPRPAISRRDSCLHALLYHPALEGHVDLRIYDHRRRYVPRRFRAPLLTLQAVLQAEEEGNAVPYTQRVRRPVMFPGVAYDVSERVTGLRGRVLRDGKPMRWTRVEAFLVNPDSAPPDPPVVVGRAHGDDRGEFLLLLSWRAVPNTGLADPLGVRVAVYGPDQPPLPGYPELPDQDCFWDLPLEQLPAIGEDDPVSAGTQLPAGYRKTASDGRIIPFQLGRMISAADGVEDFVFA